MFILFADAVADYGEPQTAKAMYISNIGKPMLLGQE